MFKVSIITPVYNAEKYLRKAVESAVSLEEVGEVILVEDKSPDNALDLCKTLENEYKKVKLFQHPDKGNHGAGASRNLGINNATYDYIAFLDADDYYLPNRFLKDKSIFYSKPETEGVYSALGIHYYSNKAKEIFKKAGFEYQEFLTISHPVPPDELFNVLFNSHPFAKGEFSTNNITLKKSVFKKIGLFNTELKLRQDIHLWKRLAAFCILEAGEINQPTAIRGVHEENRMTQKKEHLKYVDLWWKSLRIEFKHMGLESNKKKIFDQAFYNYFASHKNIVISIYYWIENLLNYPSIIKTKYGNFDLNTFNTFGKNWLTLHLISFKNKLFR